MNTSVELHTIECVKHKNIKYLKKAQHLGKKSPLLFLEIRKNYPSQYLRFCNL